MLLQNTRDTDNSQQLCQNCMVLKAQADLADKDGKKMDIGSGLYRYDFSAMRPFKISSI